MSYQHCSALTPLACATELRAALLAAVEADSGVEAAAEALAAANPTRDPARSPELLVRLSFILSTCRLREHGRARLP